jgi:hypothetical protein
MYRILFTVFFIVLCSCSFNSTHHIIQFNQLEDYQQYQYEQDSGVLKLLQNTKVVTTPIKLSKGKYTFSFYAAGTAARDQLPHIMIELGDYLLRDIKIKTGRNEYALNFEIPKDLDTALIFTYDNDYSDEKEDRNVFIYFPLRVDRF